MRLERRRRRAAGYRLHHRRLDFQESTRLEEFANLPHHVDALEEDLARSRICKQIDIALPVALLDIREPVPGTRQRPQRLREHCDRFNPDAGLSGFGGETLALDPDEVGQIKEFEEIQLLRSELLRADEKLDPVGPVVEIEEMAASHVAMRGEPARRALRIAEGESGANFSDGP